jgi:DNA helicase HerA-like ATPase
MSDRVSIYDLPDWGGDDDDDDDGLRTQGVIDAADWQYAVGQKNAIEAEGREILFEADNGEMYAGTYVREMIESRKYRPESPTWFGYTKNPKRRVEEVGIPYISLFQHIVMFGKSGFGKSTVMKNMMLQWVMAGVGMCYIDPKGKDMPKFLRMIPDHRLDDVVWIQPGGADTDWSVGFNFFDTSHPKGSAKRQEEAEAIIREFINLLSAAKGVWKGSYEGIVRAVGKQLILADEPYTVMDLYAVLDSAQELDAFLSMYESELDDMERSYIEDLKPYDRGRMEINPLLDRLKDLLSQNITRELLSHDGSNINIGRAIDEEKLLFLDISNVDEPDMPFITAAVVRRIWSNMRMRKDEETRDLDPYHLIIDEFNKVTADDGEEDMLRFDDLVSMGRAFRLSVFVANQLPEQLSEDVQKQVFNSDSVLTFNPGARNAGQLTGEIGDIDSMALSQLAKFKIMGQLTINNAKTDGLEINTFAEYPPVRTDEEVEELIEQSNQQYGVHQHDHRSLDDCGVLRFQDASEADTLTFGEFTVTPNHCLAAVASAEVGTTETIDEVSGWVDKSSLETVFLQHAPKVPFTQINRRVFQQLVGEPLEYEERFGKQFYRLTEAGRARLSALDDGDTPLTPSVLRSLSERGYLTTLPAQTSDFGYYNGAAKPPIEPVKEASTYSEATTLNAILRGNYPNVYEEFADRDVMVYTTEAPLETPEGLAEAVAAGGHRTVLIGVPESPNNELAQSVVDLLSHSEEEPAFLAGVDDTGLRTFYTAEDAVGFEDGGRVLHRADDPVWRERPTASGGPDIVLEDDDENVLVSFDSPDAVKQGVESDAVPFHVMYDEDTNQLLVKNRRDELQARYDDLDSVLRDGYVVIQEPFIPSTVFSSEAAYPDADDWTVYVVPESGDPYPYDQS